MLLTLADKKEKMGFATKRDFMLVKKKCVAFIKKELINKMCDQIAFIFFFFFIIKRRNRKTDIVSEKYLHI